VHLRDSKGERIAYDSDNFVNRVFESVRIAFLGGKSAELARKIASSVGNEENRITAIPGVSHRWRTASTQPCQTICRPGVVVVAQGSKQVNLHGTSSAVVWA